MRVLGSTTVMPLAPVKFGAQGDIPGLVGGAAAGSPAVIVIQEWWGITGNVKAQANRIAELGGYRVLIPDIYKGKVGVNVEEAQHLMSSLDFPAAISEISEAARYLKSEGAPAVGVVGFCMGGALTLGSLAASSDITCGAPFYGVNFGLFQPGQLASKPVQGHFGAEDKFKGFADVATGRKLEADLKAAGNSNVEVFVYEGVGHGFMNDNPVPFDSFAARQEKMGFPPYNSAQAELAWSRLFDFFGKHLTQQGRTEL